jgi:hypothetical protein
VAIGALTAKTTNSVTATAPGSQRQRPASRSASSAPQANAIGNNGAR